MEYCGNIRKMKTALDSEGKAQYRFILYDNLEPSHEIPMNELVGKEINLKFEHQINCVVTGKKIRKPYGEGMSYDAFMESPMAVPSIIRPELSQAHLGIGLRDLEWEIEHHVKPHYVYFALTGDVKVGVTRDTQVPIRWIDQGATEAIIFAKTPYRQAAGLIEVSLKEFMSDKTNWRNMLKNVFINTQSLQEAKEEMLPKVTGDLSEFLVDDNTVTSIKYPVLQYPEKVKSMKFDKFPEITKKLVGIKGQYLLFEDDTVINIRSQSGYKICLSV